jgi:hypothetical protein
LTARVLRIAAVVTVGLCVASLREAVAAEPVELTIRARLGFAAPEIEGAVTIRWRNPGPGPARSMELLLFANRFRSIDGMDDLARHFLVAGGSYRAGGTELTAVEEGGTALGWRSAPVASMPEGTIVTVDLAHALGVGEETRLTVQFRTRLPNLLDSFGATGDLLIAAAGWFPQPTAGESHCPSPARTTLSLTIPPESHLLLGGKRFDAQTPIEATMDRQASLVLSRVPFTERSLSVGGRTVRIYSAPSDEFAHRISRNQDAEDALADTLPDILSASKEPQELTIVRLPMRWYPSASATGMVLVSDRLFEIFPVLRPLHQRELAYAVFLDEELAAAAAREPPEDAGWVAEGLAWRRADELYRERFRSGREVQDWIRLFNVFAIVDRFDTAPRIPLIRPFYPARTSDDPLAIRLSGLCERRPPGRLLFGKLESLLGHDGFAALVARYGQTNTPMRKLLGDLGAAAFVDAWLRPYVPLNYALSDVQLNPGDVPGATLRIDRESAENRPDALDVGLEHEGSQEIASVKLDGEHTQQTLSTSAPVRAVRLDPERRVVETRLDDNRVPGQFQLLLDSADVEVSSTEFGISTLLVGRRRYDYRKDLAIAGFYTSRGTGFDAGAQWHGGTPIDANLFRQNLFAYYTFVDLDPSFENKQKPEERTSGHLSGFGLRFNFADAFWFENPSTSHHVRLFFDGYDPALGSDFGFVQGGGSLTVTRALREDTVVAGQLMNGYTAATGNGLIPNQGLFSLGGFRAIRGIGAEEQLGKGIFLGRAEVRYMLPWRLDWNFEELLIARRVQAKIFVDTGQVANNSRRLYDPADFAVGVGGGLNLFYDFMGFFPTTFYLDVATRADRGANAQVLFGVGQPF